MYKPRRGKFNGNQEWYGQHALDLIPKAAGFTLRDMYPELFGDIFADNVIFYEAPGSTYKEQYTPTFNIPNFNSLAKTNKDRFPNMPLQTSSTITIYDKAQRKKTERFLREKLWDWNIYLVLCWVEKLNIINDNGVKLQIGFYDELYTESLKSAMKKIRDGTFLNMND